MNLDLDRVSNALKSSNPDQRRIAEVGLQWLSTMLKKNADYGSSVWQTPILAPECGQATAIRVRMSDKISRLNSLLSSNKKPEVAESIEDTVSDLGAYCLLLLAAPDQDTPDILEHDMS